ncbi:MAG: PAS domain S-box protein [Betaproteobacteria bacterium]
MNTLNLRTEGKNEFEYIFDISPDLILILDKSQTIVRANQAVAIRLGVPVESLAGLKCFQVLHQGDETPGFCPHHQMLNDGKPHTLEIFLESLNGWFSLSVSPLMDKDGNLTGSVHIARDITERKEAEHKLKESEVFHRNLLTKMNGFAYCRMIYQKDQPVDFVYLMVNPAFESLTGLKEVVGKKVSELIPGILDMDPELIQSYGRVAMSGDPETFEIYLKSTEAWFSISVYCPEKEYFVAVFDVITERKVAEMALRESEENLQTIFNATDESIFLISSDKTLIAMNDVAVEMMGKSRQEMTGENIAGLLPPDLRENRLQFIDRALSTGDHISFEDERNGRHEGRIPATQCSCDISAGTLFFRP